MKNATINLIFDGGSPPVSECTSYFIVEYKLTGTDEWVRVLPMPTDYPLHINNLNENFDYDYRIAPICCDGSQGTWIMGTFTT